MTKSTAVVLEVHGSPILSQNILIWHPSAVASGVLSCKRKERQTFFGKNLLIIKILLILNLTKHSKTTCACLHLCMKLTVKRARGCGDSGNIGCSVRLCVYSWANLHNPPPKQWWMSEEVWAETVIKHMMHIPTHIQPRSHIYVHIKARKTHVQGARQQRKRSLLLALPWAICNDVSLSCQVKNYSHWKTLTVAALSGPRIKTRLSCTTPAHKHIIFPRATSLSQCKLNSHVNSASISYNATTSAGHLWPNITVAQQSSPSMTLTSWRFPLSSASTANIDWTRWLSRMK